mgnify:CR=1 FL=1
MKPIRLVLSVLLCLVIQPLFGQDLRVPLNQEFGWDYEQHQLNNAEIAPFALRSMRISRSSFDSISAALRNNSRIKTHDSWIGRKAFDEHLAKVDSPNFYFHLDPVFNLQGGQDLNDPDRGTLFTNTRGVVVEGNVTDKVMFFTSFYENQGVYPQYVWDQYRRLSGKVPGYGASKRYAEQGFDYYMSTGAIWFNPTDHWTFQFGHDKLFIGNGYRSILLSDNPHNYPFLQVQTKRKYWSYTANWAVWQTAQRTPKTTDGEPMFTRKNLNLNYLTIRPFKKLELGIFEGVVWKRWDDSTGTTKLNLNTLNPIIGVNSLLAQNDSNIASYSGLNLTYIPFSDFTAYGQLSFQGGYQLGAKYQWSKKAWRVRGQLEYNVLNQGVYGNGENNTDYHHFGQPVAHPLNEDFAEFMGYGAILYRKWIASLRYSNASSSEEYNGTLRVENVQAKLAWVFNPTTNMQLYMQAHLRKTHDDESSTQWVSFGFRTNLINQYLDF